MPTPLASSNRPRSSTATGGCFHSPRSDWRCTLCGKLLGVCQGDRLHLRFAQGHEYIVSIPASSICRGCGTLNEKSATAALDLVQPDAA
jgi:rubredoxin